MQDPYIVRSIFSKGWYPPDTSALSTLHSPLSSLDTVSSLSVLVLVSRRPRAGVSQEKLGGGEPLAWGRGLAPARGYTGYKITRKVNIRAGNEPSRSLKC